jgi:septum formation protein
MDGRVYGKPKDGKQAKKFLDELSGKRHSVYTGVAIYWQGDISVFYEKSYVTFKTLSESDKLDYIATLSPMDKAGGYGIQDSAVVKSYDGSYSNIVGLPVEKLKAQLAKILN